METGLEDSLIADLSLVLCSAMIPGSVWSFLFATMGGVAVEGGIATGPTVLCSRRRML
jgi:hypothetical protein